MKTGVRRVVLVGTGFVGMSFAYSMLNQGGLEEFVLIDVNKDKAEGEAMDLSHGLPFAPHKMDIWAGTYEDCRTADIVVITAGAAQQPGETRLDLVEKNARIMRGIVRDIMKSGFNGILVIASNPVDVLTYVAWQESGLPRHRVIGSGTTLDTARLRYEIGKYLNVDPRNVHGYIVGEHGDTEFPLWSHTTVGVMPLLDIINDNPQYKFEDLEQIYVNVRDAAYHIIDRKKATYYGIGMALTRIVKAILSDENSSLSVSVYLNGQYGQNDVFVGVPAIINRNGVREVFELNITGSERDKLAKSVAVLKETLDSVR
ncbi:MULTISPECIES: L-lactate dehydrogenase [Turicibacter]|jgi:L-lactate dehydrogenase|uniref:L-lactate dehydrogenase n=3 Tax=Turicibacter sanguinis TaxID=154288 RepID=A0A173RS00_9FIRM|nr:MULTISPECIES: L-lactate dehydrogenase [Turicibacter]EGC93335.1 L-lactate dehydrogenase [Turicibacter sp. HGF1]MBP3903323.1 L-lactate dehydrogenase [Turicibacter sp.]MCU7192189.1 L-lactate dehydrogenase [Turicibacter sanguinis]MCU7196542.1 L-lactate dehydrogenase [Turicibacter sanguinis]MCU7200781.1 L-lactate dehydrogenase [Turicibacter sanguinis]